MKILLKLFIPTFIIISNIMFSQKIDWEKNITASESLNLIVNTCIEMNNYLIIGARGESLVDSSRYAIPIIFKFIDNNLSSIFYGDKKEYLFPIQFYYDSLNNITVLSHGEGYWNDLFMGPDYIDIKKYDNKYNLVYNYYDTNSYKNNNSGPFLLSNNNYFQAYPIGFQQTLAMNLRKFDINGNLLFDKKIDSITSLLYHWITPKDMKNDNNGNIYIYGTMDTIDVNTNNDIKKVCIAKLDINFDILNLTTYSNTNLNESATFFFPLNEYSFIICGNYSPNGNSPYQTNLLFIRKVDSLANHVWETTLGDMSLDAIMDIKKTDDGGFILALKRCTDTTEYSYNFCVVKLDMFGKIEWDTSWYYNNNNRCLLENVCQLQDRNFLVTGVIGDNQLYLAKILNPLVSVKDDLLNNLNLLISYIDNKIVIQSENFERNSIIKLSIFDNLGKNLLNDAFEFSGYYEKPLFNLDAGIYFARVIDKSKSQIFKFIIY